MAACRTPPSSGSRRRSASPCTCSSRGSARGRSRTCSTSSSSSCSGSSALVLYSISGDLLREVQALSWAGQLLAVAAVLLSGWGWDVAWEVAGGGRTPGKRALGLRVVRTDGAPVGPGRVARAEPAARRRGAARLRPGRPRRRARPRRQRLGDLVAGTLVVRERRVRPLPLRGRRGRRRTRRARSRGRAGALLAPAEFERLADFLAAAPGSRPDARARSRRRLAAALARRARGRRPPEASRSRFLRRSRRTTPEAAR